MRPEVPETPAGRVGEAGVEARLYDARAADRTIDAFRETPRRLRDDQLLWVDVTGRDPDVIDRLAGVYHLHPTTAASLLVPDAERQAVRHESYLHVTLRSPQSREGRLEVLRVDLVAGRNLVITVRDGPVMAFDRFRNEIAHTTQVGRLDTATFTTALVGSILEAYLLLIEELEQTIDELDNRALRARDPAVIVADLVTLRGRAAALRRALAPHRPAFAALARPDMALDESLGRPWPALEERLEITLEAIETARTLLLGTYDIVMTRVAQRTNATVKILAILSAVLLPASLVAGIMGMNFQLPLYEDAANFGWVVLAMVALMVGTLAFAVARDRG